MDPLQNMNSMMSGGGFGGHQAETNLWSIIVNIAFGFVLGLILFIGPKEVIDYGTKLAKNLIPSVGAASSFGFASAAPYIVLAPLGGIVVKQLSSVRSLKSFGFFVGAALAGLLIAFLTRGYFTKLFV